MSKAKLPNITIKPRARYEQLHSLPKLQKYVHSYHIIIENHSQDVVQLISRHWFITNAFGQTREVQGVGVIGKQPVIEPGHSYEYDSWSPLDTPIGKMYGTFTMLNIAEQEIFDVKIPEFPLNADQLDN